MRLRPVDRGPEDPDDAGESGGRVRGRRVRAGRRLAEASSSRACTRSSRARGPRRRSRSSSSVSRAAAGGRRTADRSDRERRSPSASGARPRPGGGFAAERRRGARPRRPSRRGGRARRTYACAVPVGWATAGRLHVALPRTDAAAARGLAARRSSCSATTRAATLPGEQDQPDAARIRDHRRGRRGDRRPSAPGDAERALRAGADRVPARDRVLRLSRVAGAARRHRDVAGRARRPSSTARRC